MMISTGERNHSQNILYSSEIDEDVVSHYRESSTLHIIEMSQ
jgi:hypothetical protein